MIACRSYAITLRSFLVGRSSFDRAADAVTHYSTIRKVYAFPVDPLTLELVRPGARNAYSPGSRLVGSTSLYVRFAILVCSNAIRSRVAPSGA